MKAKELTTWDKLNPWNWFKHENDEQSIHHIPITRHEARQINLLAESESLFRLHREMDRLFNNVFNSVDMPSVRSALLGIGSHYRPQIDVSGDDKHYEVTLDVPGLPEADLSIEIIGNKLTIKGKKEENTETKNKQFYCMERSYGTFQRTLSLPGDANTDSMNANLKEGVFKS